MKKASQSLAVTKKDLKKIETKVGNLGKKVGGLEKEVKIIKVEVRKFNTKLDRIRNKVWLDMESLKDEMKDEMTLLRSDVAGMKDEVVTEIKAMREEFTVHQGTHIRQQETLENHEKRITSLEPTKFS